jgi:hypothetical protein
MGWLLGDVGHNILGFTGLAGIKCIAQMDHTPSHGQVLALGLIYYAFGVFFAGICFDCTFCYKSFIHTSHPNSSTLYSTLSQGCRFVGALLMLSKTVGVATNDIIPARDGNRTNLA